MRLRQRLTAVSADGQQVELHVWVSQIDASTLDRGRVFIDGLPELRTATGLAVNRLARGRYQIVQTGVILESTDPGAP